MLHLFPKFVNIFLTLNSQVIIIDIIRSNEENMKKLLLIVFLLIVFTNLSFAATTYKIKNLKNGMVIKCTGAKKDGLIEEYDKKVIDYYTYQDGEIYSKNLVNMYKDGKGEAKKVKKLKITDSQITFKDRIITAKTTNRKLVTIDRKTGKYTFEAKKQYNWAWFHKKAYVVGTCRI